MDLVMIDQCRIYASTMTCLSCHGGVTFHEHNSIVYGRDYGNGMIYICNNFPSCNSYVGVHTDTGKPLGSVAGKSIRAARMAAHGAFDKLWRQGEMDRRFIKRENAYEWLAQYLGMPRPDVHIGLFDEAQCWRVIEFSKMIVENHPHGSRLGSVKTSERQSGDKDEHSA